MLRKIIIMLVFVTGLFSACLSSRYYEVRYRDTVKKYHCKYESMFTVVESVLAEHTIPVETMNRNSGTVTSRILEVDPQSEFGKSLFYVDPWEDVKRERYCVNIEMEALSEEDTRVHIILNLEKYVMPFRGEQYRWVSVASNGYLEKLLFTTMNAAIENQ